MGTLLIQAPKFDFIRKTKSLQEWLFLIRNKYVFAVAEKKCDHPYEPHIITIETTVNCETTVLVCPCCRQWLT